MPRNAKSMMHSESPCSHLSPATIPFKILNQFHSQTRKTVNTMLSLTFWHAHASQWCNGVMTTESQFVDSFYYAVQVRIIDKER